MGGSPVEKHAEQNELNGRAPRPAFFMANSALHNLRRHRWQCNKQQGIKVYLP